MDNELHNKIQNLKSQSEEISQLVSMISKEKLAEPIKSGAWSMNQIVHHIADAHLHAYMRIMWIYTEKITKLKTFDQDAWVEAPSTDNHDLKGSLSLLSGICERWSKLSINLTAEDWKKTGIHPVSGEMSIEYIFNFFVDHAEAHLKQLRELIN